MAETKPHPQPEPMRVVADAVLLTIANQLAEIDEALAGMRATLRTLLNDPRLAVRLQQRTGTGPADEPAATGNPEPQPSTPSAASDSAPARTPRSRGKTRPRRHPAG